MIEIDISDTPRIEKLQVKCRSLIVERTYTPGFTISADQYNSLGPFVTALHISYPTGANKIVSIVQVRTIGSDICVRDVLLDVTGSANAADYNVSDTHMIYAMLKSVIVGSNTIQCCDTFDYTNCPTSNYIRFAVTDTGSVQFLSNPSGAEIWLAPIGQIPVYQNKTAPDTIANLPIGDYDYILKLTNYNDYIGSTPVTVIKDQVAIVGPISLVPAEGCIYFTSSPPGAQIFLGTTLASVVDTGFNTPKLICGLSLGSHVFKLQLAGYDDVIDTAILSAGSGLIITKTLRQSPILSDILISPINPSVVINGAQSFSATPIDQYGDPFPATVTWSNSNSFVGNIDANTGLFTALHTGTTIITAASGNVSNNTTATVTSVVPVLTTITVSPATTSIPEGTGTIFTASALDQFNNPITTTIVWSSSNPTVGITSQNGVFQALSQGTTVITASSGNVSGVAIVNVTSITGAQTGFGILGNINTAALILAGAMIASVMITKYNKIQIVSPVTSTEQI